MERRGMSKNLQGLSALERLGTSKNLQALSALLSHREEDDDDDDDDHQSVAPSAHLGPGHIGPPTTTRKEEAVTTVCKKKTTHIWSEEEVAEGPRYEDLADPRPQPDYEVILKQSVGTQDVFLGMSGKDPSSMCCEAMLVRVKLPDTNATDVALDVRETFLDLRTPKYKLGLHLPHAVHSQEGKAQFYSEKEELEVTLFINRTQSFKQHVTHSTTNLTSAVAENIMAAASGSESRRAAKRTRLDTYHGGGTSVSISSPDTLVHVEHTHPNKVLEGLNRLRLNRALCDVVLCCGGQEFPCHRYVLASFSPYFEAMFTSGMVESTQEKVTISAVEPQVFGMLVNYAYTSEVSISAANVQALLVASNLLDIMAIRETCCEYIEHHMDISNCVGINCFAKAQCCEMLAEYSMDYILEYFSDIYQQEDFLSLSVEELTVILASDHLNVPKEDMVFEAAMLWLDKCPTRRQNFEKVLEQIRLPLISPSYRHTVIESLDVVKEYQGCQRFISEAKDQSFCKTARPRRTTVIVTVGGWNMGEIYDRIESFDPLTNQWKTLGCLPLETEGRLPVYDPATFKSGCTLYLTGGPCHSVNKEMFCYDVSHNSWRSAPLAPMNKQFMGNFKMVMLDGYVYAFGGELNSFEKYDPHADTWQLVDSVDLQAFSDSIDDFPTVGALEGHLYFIGAQAPGGRARRFISKVAKYNPETSVWTEVAPMQNPHRCPTVCTLNGKLYAIDLEYYIYGDDPDDPGKLNVMECYNPETNQWTMCAPMQERRVGHCAVVVDGKIYVLGGTDGDNGLVQNIERYCAETDTWETVGQMPNIRHGFSCISFKLRKDCAAIVDAYESDYYVDYESDYYVDWVPACTP